MTQNEPLLPPEDVDALPARSGRATWAADLSAALLPDGFLREALAELEQG